MTTTATIVPMTDAHIDMLIAFEREMFGPEAWTAGSYREMLRDAKHKRFVTALDEDGGLLGWAGLMVNGDTAEVMTVGTVPSARRRGIGAQLTNVLIDEARARCAVELFLEVRIDNDAARALYEGLGFETVGIRRRYYDNGRVDGLTMRLGLAHD
jgi:ribosomal-protein-alanine N-acetyltransferase